MHTPNSWYHAMTSNSWYHALGGHPAGLPAWSPLLIAAVLAIVAMAAAVAVRRRVPSR